MARVATNERRQHRCESHAGARHKSEQFGVFTAMLMMSHRRWFVTHYTALPENGDKCGEILTPLGLGARAERRIESSETLEGPPSKSHVRAGRVRAHAVDGEDVVGYTVLVMRQNPAAT